MIITINGFRICWPVEEKYYHLMTFGKVGHVLNQILLSYYFQCGNYNSHGEEINNPPGSFLEKPVIVLIWENSGEHIKRNITYRVIHKIVESYFTPEIHIIL